jgi:predicted ABC-type ATPase
MRVFAGPNGSGKTTIIQGIRKYRINEQPVDFGIYINADDIARDLQEGKFNFSTYKIKTSRSHFVNTVLKSGLVNKEFNEKAFKGSFRFNGQRLNLVKPKHDERMAQILAHFLREELLQREVKFSFETVFSHESKLDIMKRAKENGYKVYLYFVSTESPEINLYRVSLRKEKGGHEVPEEKIKSRYYRSLDLMFDAAQVAYHAYFFDNSGQEPKLFAHFKQSQAGNKQWDEINTSEVPQWFKQYYSKKARLS